MSYTLFFVNACYSLHVCMILFMSILYCLVVSCVKQISFSIRKSEDNSLPLVYIPYQLIYEVNFI